MSLENHPNLHAVGLLTDIFAALEKRTRGRAAEYKVHHTTDVTDLCQEFVVDLSNLFDTIVDIEEQDKETEVKNQDDEIKTALAEQGITVLSPEDFLKGKWTEVNEKQADDRMNRRKNDNKENRCPVCGEFNGDYGCVTIGCPGQDEKEGE